MKIAVHFPESEAALASLQEQVALVHAGAAADYVSRLNCPKEQKIELLGALSAHS